MRFIHVVLCITPLWLLAGELQYRMPNSREQKYIAAVGALTLKRKQEVAELEAILQENGMPIFSQQERDATRFALQHIQNRLGVDVFETYYQRAGGDAVINQFKGPWYTLWKNHPDKHLIEKATEQYIQKHRKEVLRRHPHDVRERLSRCTLAYTMQEPEYDDAFVQKIHEKMFYGDVYQNTSLRNVSQTSIFTLTCKLLSVILSQR